MSRGSIYSARAEADLQAIYADLCKYSEAVADRIVREIDRKCHVIAAHPRMGQARRELGSDVRHWPVGKYVVFYRPVGDSIEVIRVLHGRRNLPDLV